MSDYLTSESQTSSPQNPTVDPPVIPPNRFSHNSMKAPYPEIGDILHDKYQVTRQIGAGAFGAIFEVQNVEDGNLYAVKLERSEVQPCQLLPEYKLYKMLNNAPAFPAVYDFWNEKEWRGMVMDRLGFSLGYHYRHCGRKMSMKTVLHCAVQMISRLEYLHQRSHVHRDIKPDNFVFGVGTNANTLYLIDLGLARKYRNMTTLDPFPYEEGRGLIGTTRYVSINVHLGVEQSCRDDLESVGYVLIALALGRLPWDDLGDVANEIQEAKMNIPPDLLCQDLPNAFFQYMDNVRALKFDARPQYTLLRGLFVQTMIKQNLAFDFRYDWVIAREQRLDAALRGVTEPGKIVIPVGPNDIATGEKAKAKAANCMQPLPFFTSIHQAASFMGRSRRTAEADEEAEKSPPWENKDQDGFLLDPGRVKLPGNVEDVEFEVVRPDAPETG
jgi:serine/threonine protein kinase